MARDFSKNLSNYLSFGTAPQNPITGLLNGTAGLSVSALIYWRTLSATLNDNLIVSAILNTTTTGLTLGVDGQTSAGKGRVRITARSVSTDARQAQSGATDLNANTWYQIGGSVNIAADLMYGVLDGNVDVNTPAPVFANTNLTVGSPTVNDGIGTFAPGSASDILSARFDGLIAELAIWNTDLHPDDWTALGARRAPFHIHPQNLVAYWPLLGVNPSAEPEMIARVADAVVVGSVPVADHPRVLRF